MPLLYREAVATSRPTLPLGGYGVYRCMKKATTPAGLGRIGESIPRVASAATLG